MSARGGKALRIDNPNPRITSQNTTFVFEQSTPVARYLCHQPAAGGARGVAILGTVVAKKYLTIERSPLANGTRIKLPFLVSYGGS